MNDRPVKTDYRWLKLDNAAKIYPAAMSRGWTAMFRVSAELTEPIDFETLKLAQKKVLERMPSFSVKLRRGFFWYYLERIDGAPEVRGDVANPLVRMNLRENGGFMFRVRVHECRIAVEFFHVLTDGTGGLTFLKTLVAEYLRLKHGLNIPAGDGVLDCSSPPLEGELEDSFMKYARPASRSRKESAAYHIHETPEDKYFINIVTGMTDASLLKEVAHSHGATVNELLTALLILAVRSVQRTEVNRRRRVRPIKVCVPINLRKYYKNNTLRNFSSFVNPGIFPEYGEFTLDETILFVKGFMAVEGSEKMLNVRMSTNVHSETNPFIRLVPLFIKNPIMKIIYIINGDRTSSTTLSNLGVVTVPEEMSEYVTRFDFMLGSLRTNPVTLACATYRGNLVMNFTRTIKEPIIEREFFRSLVKLGLHVTVESNMRY